VNHAFAPLWGGSEDKYMPSSAFLDMDLRCPGCGATLSGIVWFQWGYCGASVPVKESLYRVGDNIRWYACMDGTILPWTEFDDGNKGWGSNIGDPQIRNIIVRDDRQFGWDHPEDRRVCSSCASPIEGAVVEIRDGQIVGGRIFQSGEFDPQVTYYALASSGSPTPLLDWENHAMQLKSPDCNEWQESLD
jgi:hypothetical protein